MFYPSHAYAPLTMGRELCCSWLSFAILLDMLRINISCCLLNRVGKEELTNQRKRTGLDYYHVRKRIDLLNNSQR